MLIVLALLAGSAHAVPMELNHQGRLMDATTGIPLQGNHDIALTLYDSPAGGNVLWTETSSVPFTEGYYAVVLGTDVANPLDDLTFASGNAFLALSVDGGAELVNRQAVVSVPYAFLANTATNVDGGVVNATEIQINGSTVIDASGSFLGTGDGDTLAGLGCGVNQVAMYNGAGWACANAAVDTTLSEAEVEFFIENNAITLALGTTLNGSVISTGAHSLQLSEADVESFITNGPIDLFVGSLIDGTPIATGAHTVDTDTQLSDAEVDAFVQNGPLNFAALSTLGGATITTGAHTVDTTLSDAEVDAFVQNGPLTLAAGTSLAGAVIATGAHTIDTNTQLSEATVEGFITNGALDLDGATTLGGAVISTGPHTIDTQLTDAEVDAFVINGALDLAPGTTLDGADLFTTDGGTLNGSLQLGDSSTVCTAAEAGTLRWFGNALELCAGTEWQRVLTSGAGDGGIQSNAGQTCNDIHTTYPALSSGLYWIDPDGDGDTTDAWQAYCDMNRDGGGWTMVMQNNQAIATPSSMDWNASVNVASTVRGGVLSNDPSSFDVHVGLAEWAQIGIEGRVEVGSINGTPTKQATYTSMTVDAANNYQLVMSGETLVLGATSPGIFSYHAGNAYQWSASDVDNDIYPTACEALYGHPWWYGQCWSGSLWGGTPGYVEAAYWDGSSGDYWAWGALWLR